MTGSAMQKLLSELRRLYLLDEQQYREPGKDGAGDLTPAILERHLRGEQTIALDLVTPDGLTRVLLIDFHGAAEGKGERHWSALCEVAHAMQATLELPAPAVSISGGAGNGGYGLWLSLETPVPAAQAREFSELLRGAYCPDIDSQSVAVAELPPCLQAATGKWAAFINPGMGASFAEEPALDMAPPLDAQAAFLVGLRSISAAQFARALDILRSKQVATPVPHPPTQDAIAAPSGLLLKDATLEDIVRHLHAKNIEPAFRHLIVK